MKKYLSFFVVCGLMLVMLSCEDFLIRDPLDELTPEQYFTNANALKLYANRFYPLLPGHGMYGGGTFWSDQVSDNLVPAAADMRLSGTRTIPASKAGWEWGDIRQANYFLDHCFDVKVDSAECLIYIAEVKFFKAFLYFDKLKTFGNVPWFTHALYTSSPELFAPRDSRKVVTDSIIACLDYAIANLPVKSHAQQDRLNKESAILLKARICLYEGTWEKYQNGTDFGVPGENGTGFLQLAVETADSLMRMGTASLYKGPAGKEYWSLFNELDYTDNPEVLMWKKYDVGLGLYHLVGQYLPFGAGDMGISKSLVDDYLCTDGKPISVSPNFMGYDSLLGEAMNRDPRMAQSVFLPGDDQTINSPGGISDLKFTKPNIDQTGQNRATTGYCIYKGVNVEYSQHQGTGGTMGSIIFRYTEALLIFAEAKAELGTITQTDIDNTINLIRDRVGMIHLDMGDIATDPDWDFPSLSPLINEIRRERRIELAFEGLRWDDLARWRAHDVFVGKRPKGIKYLGSNLEGNYFDPLGHPSITIGVTLFVDANGFVDPYQVVLPSGFGFDPGRDYLSPIPSDEITLNDKLGQNPGW
jgi:starch-binding outer membrane protein, SusD/RagB family